MKRMKSARGPAGSGPEDDEAPLCHLADVEDSSAKALVSLKEGSLSQTWNEKYSSPQKTPIWKGGSSPTADVPPRSSKRSRLICEEEERQVNTRSPKRNQKTAIVPQKFTSTTTTPVKKASQKIGYRLRNLLKLPKAHKWCIYEWFYSNIDKPLFEGDNDFCVCLKESFPNLKTRKLARVEWGKIRRLMGKPRRCSAAFFEEERSALEQKRQKIRLLQQRKVADVSQFKDLPDEIPLSLVIGTKVTARLRGVHDGLFTGQIDAVDTQNSTYRVTFDRNGLGTHTIPDYEVLSNEPHETMPIASFGQKQRPSRMFMTPPRLQYPPPIQSPITLKKDPKASIPGGKKKRRSYEAAFKLKVVSRAEESNNSIASREFRVDEKQVREWRKMKAALRKIPKTKKAQRGLTTSYEALETELHKWVTERGQNGYCVTRMEIRRRALQMAKDDKFKAIGIENFGASAGWCTRFMNRFSLCLRQRTKISPKLPKDLHAKVASFHSFILKQRKIHNYDLGDIGNMDETLMTFDLPSNRSRASLGEKTILPGTTGNENHHFTVVLSCLANGTKLRPVIIFKRKTLPKKVTFPSGITVRSHVKGCMDEDGTKKWMEEIWNGRPGAALQKKPSLLVWDAFRAHSSEDIKKLARSSQVTLAVIPGGHTPALQPLNVSLNKPFKDRVRKMWHEWMTSGQARLTKAGNLMKPHIELIATWVRDAWEAIPEEMVKLAFKKCGISNAMDGSEDSALYDNDSTDDDD